MAVPALPQDFIGLKISIYITLSTPQIKSAFGPLSSFVVVRVVGPGRELILFFQRINCEFFTLTVENYLIGEVNSYKRIFLIDHK